MSQFLKLGQVSSTRARTRVRVCVWAMHALSSWDKSAGEKGVFKVYHYECESVGINYSTLHPLKALNQR